MTTGRWRVTAWTAQPGWLDMPDAGDDVVDRAWLDAREVELRAAFGKRWNDELAGIVPTLLRAGLERREPGDLIAWQVWPLALPLFATVRARVVASGGVPDWRAEGDSMRPFASAGLGAGVQVRASSRAEGFEEVLVAAMLFAFDDGDSALVVSVEPTPHELLAFVAPGLQQLVDRMELTRPDGSRFSGERSEHFVDDEGWQTDMGAA